jgi:hypothetical protein
VPPWIHVVALQKYSFENYTFATKPARVSNL